MQIKKILPFRGTYYSAKFRASMCDLAVPAWTADELWGPKEWPENFRNCLVGTAEECAATWSRWRTTGVFESEAKDSYYILRQNFRFRNREYERWAVFASLSVLNNNIKVHEEVSLEGAENTRKRFQACRGDLTPVFVGLAEEHSHSLHDLLRGITSPTSLLYEFTDKQGAGHTLWKAIKPEEIKAITAYFADKNFYLLDGHHRLRGAQDNHKMKLGDGRLLACISSLDDSDLLILPIHRAVLCEQWLLPDLAMQRLRELGCKVIRRQSWTQQSLEDVIFTTDWQSSQFYFLPVQSAELFFMQLPQKGNSDSLVIERIERELFAQIPHSSLLPVNDVTLLTQQLASGQAQAAILLPPLKPSVVREAADAGEILPRKSTQFYPKPALGLVCRQW